MTEEFSWPRFIIVSIITVVPFLWLKYKPIKEKLFIGTFILFLFIYSGVGFSWSNCDVDYIYLYSVYLLLLSYSIYIAQKGSEFDTMHDLKVSKAVNYLVLKYGDFFIYSYVILCVMSLVVKGRFYALFLLPQLDMDAAVSATFEDNDNGFVYYLKSIFYVFYIVSLYKYRFNLKKFFFFLLAPVYITLIEDSYLGRGTMMVNAIILLVNICICYPKQQKKIIIITGLGLPILAWALSWYSFYRKGLSFSLSYSDALSLLSYAETSYPSHFNNISNWNFSLKVFSSYFEWLLTLPLPGFLKQSSSDFSFNFIFSERLLGMARGVDGFNVLLPGVVNESLFIFGSFFPLHAIIYGLIIGKLYKLLRHDGELLLLIYCCVNSAYAISRAGTTASYPFFFKHLLIYLIVIIFLSNKQKYEKNSCCNIS